MTKDDLGELICNSATRLISDANEIIGLVRRGEAIDDFRSAVDFIEVLAIELTALKAFLVMWEKME